MIMEMIKSGVGGSGGITTITGAAQQETTFTAVVGHRYLVAFDSLSYSSGQTAIEGLNVEVDSGLLTSAAYNSSDARLRVVIGTATSATVHCSYRSDPQKQYANVIWIDLDAQ